MERATPTTTDLRQAFMCAALATITSLGMFSAVANVMTPMFAGSLLLNGRPPAQGLRTAYGAAAFGGATGASDAACIPTSHVRDTPEFTRLTTI
jgi:hypothetical protein